MHHWRCQAIGFALSRDSSTRNLGSSIRTAAFVSQAEDFYKSPLTSHRGYDRCMTYLALITLIIGLLMFLLCKGDAKEIGRMLFIAAAIGIMAAAGPGTLHILK
jgi:hypothetical protein